jgi:hypothetical protein
MLLHVAYTPHFLFQSLKYLPAPRRGYQPVPLLYYHHCRRTVADIFVAAVISIPQSYYKFIFMKIPERWNKKISILYSIVHHIHVIALYRNFFLSPVIWNSTRNIFWFLSSFLYLLCIYSYISRNLVVAFLCRYDTLCRVSGRYSTRRCINTNVRSVRQRSRCSTTEW